MSRTERFLEACGKILGPGSVRGPRDPELIRDQFGPYFDTPNEPLAGGSVHPANLEELTALVRLANEHGVSLWTSSRGRNFGYGGPAPVRSGDIALDLRRMDRILEIDKERAFAVVEPGVTPEMLLNEIRRRGLKLWPDGVSSPYGSIIGNASERGIGYGLHGDRFGALCGLEVLLADGTLIRTGTGSMSNSTTWHEHKHGYGPHLDGLFSQSNLGIITKAGVWMIPEPEAFRHSEVFLEGLDELEGLVDTLGRLRRARVLETAVSSTPPPPAPGGPGNDKLRVRLGYLGSARSVEAKWQDTLDALSGFTTLRIDTAYYEAPYEWQDWDANARLAAGLPTPLEEGDWSVAHHWLFAGLVIPNDGHSFAEAHRMMEAVYAKHDRVLPFPPGFHMHTPRALVLVCPVELRGNPMMPDGAGMRVDNETSVRIVSDILDEAERRGWNEYRTATMFMDKVAAMQDFGDHARARVLDRIKDALDPNGILSPGKSGIWGSAQAPAG